ncbi:MAG: RsfA family transcriptional regulator [Bacillota bacterium]
MTKLRQDAWSHEEDILLKDTVLKYIESGQTQLEAFDLVAHELRRTPDACGFRWNKELRGRYQAEIREAKNLRHLSLQKRRQNKTSVKSKSTKAVPKEIHTLFARLEHYTDKQQGIIRDQTKEIEQLKLDNKKLEQTVHQLETKLTSVEEDYHTFISIMERARKMVVLDPSDQQTFTMDKNGNLESIAK